MLRLAKDGRIGGVGDSAAADPDVLAVICAVMGERRARKDQKWMPTVAEICGMLPDPTGKGRHRKQAERVMEKIRPAFGHLE